MALSAADLQAVYSLLLNSLSPDESTRKPAESALSQCENRPGFCSCLLEIIAARGLAGREDVRLLASVYFKNSINRYWRRRRDSSPGISNEEKIHLRKNLLLHIREENTQISLQMAVLISKIARIDYPKDWPDLFSFLAQQLQTTDVLTSHRVIMVLFRTLKELSRKCLAADVRNFSQITALLFEYTWNFWKGDVQTILQNFSALSQRSDNMDSHVEQLNDFLLICDRFLYCSKIVRQLIISGFQTDSTTAQEIGHVKEVCPTLLSAIQSFLPYYSSFRGRQEKLYEFTKRACIKLAKVLIIIQNRHPYSFGHQSILPNTMDFSLNLITNPEQIGSQFEELLIQSMVLVKSVLECKEYRKSLIGRVISQSGNNDNNGGALTLEERKKSVSSAVNEMMKTILLNDRVVLLCNILIRRHFIYTANDLDEWNSSPETFHHEQNLVQWTEKQRHCAEALFIVLFENYKEILGPVVVSILREAMSVSPPMETELTPGMLLKDASYTACGHVYYELSNFLNFDEWFHGSLAIELANNHPNMRIIHRKIALLLGQWISEIKGDTRKLVFHALIKLLQENDIAVRLAACSSLCYFVQDMNSSEQDLLELLPLCWPLCFKLMDDVQEFDSKVQVLNFISVLIQHVGDKVVPYANQLSQFFYKLWEESSGESILQIQVLVALKNFVTSLGYQISGCYDMILPILQIGINVDSPDSLNLLEDSVQLWEATLSNSPSVPSQFLDLFPFLVSIVDRSLEHLEVVNSIMEDYIILCGAEFLTRHASSLSKVLYIIIANVNDKGLLSTLNIVDLLIQCFPNEAPPLITNILQKLVYVSLCGDDEQNPKRTVVRVTSGAILARVLVMNTNYMAQLISEPSLSVGLQQAGLTVSQNILLSLVDVWVDKMDNAAPLQRKTYALALAIILTLRVPEVLDKLDDILSVCTSVIIGATTDDQSDHDSSFEENIEYATAASKEFRKKQIKDSDPIKKLSLEDMLRENLKACANLHGEASFNAAITRIHPSAFAQLKHALKMA